MLLALKTLHSRNPLCPWQKGWLVTLALLTVPSCACGCVYVCVHVCAHLLTSSRMGYIFTLPGSAVFSEGQSLVEQSGELARPESDVAGGESIL